MDVRGDKRPSVHGTRKMYSQLVLAEWMAPEVVCLQQQKFQVYPDAWSFTLPLRSRCHSVSIRLLTWLISAQGGNAALRGDPSRGSALLIMAVLLMSTTGLGQCRWHHQCSHGGGCAYPQCGWASQWVCLLQVRTHCLLHKRFP